MSMPPPPLPPSSAGKAKAKGGAKAKAKAAAAAASQQQLLEVPFNRRESEGSTTEEKRLSAGTILDFYTEAVPSDDLAGAALGVGKTPAAVPPPVQVTMSAGSEGHKDGASPLGADGQLSPLNLALGDVLTAF